MADADSEFAARLSRSMTAVMHVATWLVRRGHDVRMSGMQLAGPDQGDLFVGQPVEVKHISKDFTGRTDWPFGDKFIVCSQKSWDAKRIKPFAYVIVSDSLKYAGVVGGDLADKWTIEQRIDNRTGLTDSYYLCPVDLVAFVRLEV